jgi:Family of unknown function (DUF6220)
VIVAPTRRSTRRANQWHRRIARVLLGGLALQLFFAGLGVFGVTTFLPHMILGTGIVVASLALPMVAWRGHLEATVQRLSWLLAGLMLLQGLLIDLGRVAHVISALHPVNAMLLVLVTYSLARRAV